MKNIWLKMFILLLLLFPIKGWCSPGMRGTEFCLGFLPNYSYSHLTVHLYSTEFTSVIISIPKKNWQTTVLLMGNQSTAVSIPTDIGTANLSNPGNAIYINSEAEITVYASNFLQYSSDATFILPTKTLKDEYYLISYDYPSGFLIVANEDATKVEISYKNTSYSITLNKGDTYYYSTFDETTGTKIKTTNPCKKIAVFAGADCANVPIYCGACDHLFQQILPTNYLGKQYFLPKVEKTSVLLKVLAIEDNTRIYINSQFTKLLSAGESFEINSLRTAAEISSNNNFVAAIFLEGYQCSNEGDPAFSILIPTHQFVKEVDLILPDLGSNHTYYLTFITKANAANQINIKNQNPQIQFSPIPGTSYVSGSFKAEPGNFIISSNSELMVFAYALSEWESFLFAGAIAGESYQLTMDPEICIGASSTFSITGQNISSAYWQFNFDTLSGESINPTFANEGYFTGEVIVFSSSEYCPDTVRFQYLVKSKPTIKVNSEITICKNSNFLLQPEIKNAISTFWSNGENGKSIFINDEGWYFITAENTCGLTEDSVYVFVKPLPDVTLGNDTTILIGTTAQIRGNASEGAYNWYPTNHLSCFGCLTPIFTGQKTQSYVLAVTDKNGCVNKDTITIYVDPDLAVYVPNIFSPNGDGVNDFFYVRGKGIQSLRMMIFSRWGELIFETSDINQGWDGTYKGSILKNEVFVYHLEAVLVNDQRVIKSGDVTLLR
jgi:gliding motility-associated-like protein